MRNTSYTSSMLQLLVPVVLAAVLPLSAEINRESTSSVNASVLYVGPLSHDQNWIIRSGPPSPDNQKFRALGGTCSMVPMDVSNNGGSGREEVTFEAERLGLGLWKMAWTDTVSGNASDGNRYKYRQRLEYVGATIDGKAPKPSRKFPTSENDGFLQPIPSNVTTDALELSDLFLLQTPEGSVAASSHLHWTLRLQIPPVETDPPPAFLPAVLLGGYVVNLHDQLAGQLGCDPL